MKYRILITPLYGVIAGGKLQYYFNESEDRTCYCDALLSAEASCKYVLANENIDEIITFGTKSTYDPEDGLKSVVLKEGHSFYTTNIKDMSTYSLFRYRLAEYLDDINAEEQDIRELLNEEQQKAAADFVEGFFKKFNSSGNTRFSRFFNHLMQDYELREEMKSAMNEAIPDFDAFSKNYITWSYQYLYNEMKDSAKMEILENNSDVKIRFIPVGSDAIGAFVENFTRIMKNFGNPDNPHEVEVYMCIQSEDASDTFVMMNIMNLIKAMPESNISIAKIITTTKNPDGIISEISDDTDKFAVTDLLAGIRAFLKYGKTDLLLDYWNSTGLHNADIEQLLYAMRNIDTGISLCDISDIERGIDSLREIFREERNFGGDSFAEKFFGMIAESIRQDYGTLIKNDEIEFIDLVKWAYNKGFWQQTLTIIESKAPDDIVRKGFFYYSNSPECTQSVLKVLGQAYYDLKPYEKWKITNSVEHYYLKSYTVNRAPHKGDPRSNQMEMAKNKVTELDVAEGEGIRAHSLCSDREALKNLIFAYYYVGIVRNTTNHATEEFEGFASIMRDSDLGERMNKIIQSLDYFIHSYDVVAENVKASGKPVDVELITVDQVIEFSKTLKPRFDDRDDRDNRGYRDNRDNRDYRNNKNYKYHKKWNDHKDDNRPQTPRPENVTSEASNSEQNKPE